MTKGRHDTDKLGIAVVRVCQSGHVNHIVRSTVGQTADRPRTGEQGVGRSRSDVKIGPLQRVFVSQWRTDGAI